MLWDSVSTKCPEKAKPCPQKIALRWPRLEAGKRNSREVT
jgi:hypothetical protein